MEPRLPLFDFGERGMRGARDVRAFRILLAVAEQADARALNAAHDAGVRLAHHRELHQVERPALHVGAGIDQAGPTGQGRHDRHDGRPVHLRQIAQQRNGQAQDGARISGADHGAGVPVLDVLEGDAQGRIPFAAQRGHGRFAHFDDFAGVLHGEARRLGLSEAGQFLADAVPVADQQNRHAVLLCRLDGTRHNGLGGVVSPHRVHGNLGAGHGTAVPGGVLARPSDDARGWEARRLRRSR